MFSKIVAWTWLIMSILGLIVILVEPSDYFLFSVFYFSGVAYISAKYLESLK